jgi:hypothetical protein
MNGHFNQFISQGSTRAFYKMVHWHLIFLSSLPFLCVPQAYSSPPVRDLTRLQLLTVLNEETFQSDQQVFARTLNSKNAELKLSGLELHSVELAAKVGLVEHLQDLCGAAASSGSAWLAILNFAQPSSVFSSAMVGQQMALPVLGYVNTLAPEIFLVSALAFL